MAHGIVQSGNIIAAYLTYLSKRKVDGILSVERVAYWAYYDCDNNVKGFEAILTEPKQVIEKA